MKKIFSLKIFAIVIALLLMSVPFYALAEEETASQTEINQNVAKEVAYAFLRKVDNVLYDQLNSRRHMSMSPENATSQKPIYLDCSSFVNSCYIEGFGINILPFPLTEKSANTSNFNVYARDNGTNPDVIGYWENTQWADAEGKQSIIDFIAENIQVGDILNYRHLKSSGSYAGHVYIYVGNNVFIHCAGAGSYVVKSDPSKSYEMDEGENSRMQSIKWSSIFTTTTSARYIFKATDADTVTSFCLLRPLAREGVTPTQESLNRLNIAGLSMEKTSAVAHNTAVNVGDTITYTVTMKNTNTTDMTGVVIADTIPVGTEYVSGDEGVSVTEGKLSWTGDIPASETVSVSYTVKVLATADKLIVSDETTVGGVCLLKITHTVSKYTKVQSDLFATVAKRYASEAKVFESTIDMAFNLYSSVLGIDLTGYIPEGTDGAKDNIILDNTIDTENLTCYTDTDFAKMIAPSLYGGRSIVAGQYKIPDNYRSRLVEESDLAVGDIIIAEYNGECTDYVYAGDSTLVTVDNGVTVAKTIGDDIYGTDADNILVSLIAYNRYVVIRPSMTTEQSQVGVASLEISTPPTNMAYFPNDEFNPEGMVVTATFTNGIKAQVTDYTFTHDAFTYPSTKVTVAYDGVSTSLDVTVLKIDSISVSTLPTKMSYYNKELFDPEGMVVVANISNGDTIEITDYTVSPQELVYPDNTVTVTSGELTTSFEVVLSSEYPTVSVSEALLLDKGLTVNVEGYYVGVGDAGYSVVYVLLKDINSDAFICVSGITSAYPEYSTLYKYGDKLKFTVTTSETSGEFDTGRKVLVFSEENGGLDNTVISSGNKITYNLENALTAGTQAQLKTALNSNDNYYKYVKITGKTYFQYYKSDRYRVNKNGATSANGMRINGKLQVANFTLASNNANLGINWYKNLFTTKDSALPGALTEKTFYALFISESEYYTSLLILDESWIIEPLQVKGMSLLLDGKIGTKVYFEYDSNCVDTETLTMTGVITNSDDDTTEEINVPITFEDDGKTAYGIVYVAPKDIDNTSVDVTVSGKTLSGADLILDDIPSITVPHYIETLKSLAETDEECAKAFDVTLSLEKYCDYANKYFDKNVETVDEIELSTYQKNRLDDFAIPPQLSANTLGALKYYSSSLILNESVTIRHYFTVTGEINLEDYTVESASALANARGNNGLVYIDITDIPAQRLSEYKTATVSYNNNSMTIKFSPLNYAGLTYKSSDVKLRNLVKSIAEYSYEADLYVLGKDYDLEIDYDENEIEIDKW